MRGLLLVLSLTLACVANAEIYHYRDDAGRRVFVDSLSKVPAEYRNLLETRALPPVQPEADTAPDQAKVLAELDAALAELETPVQIWGNRVLVPVQVKQGRRSINTQLVLDTGASGTVFHADALTRLRYSGRDAGFAEVANGARVPIQRVRFSALQIGPFELDNAEVMVMENTSSQARHDGLLGMDFLRAAQYQVDYERQRLIWFPQRYRDLQQQRQQLLENTGHHLIIKSRFISGF